MANGKFGNGQCYGVGDGKGLGATPVTVLTFVTSVAFQENFTSADEVASKIIVNPFTLDFAII